MYVARSRRVSEPLPDDRPGTALHDPDHDDHETGLGSTAASTSAGGAGGGANGGTIPGGGRRRRRGRPSRKVFVAGLALVALVATGTLLLRQDSTVEAGVPDGTDLSPTGKLVITRDGTTIDARDVSGPIYIKADDVTVRRTRVTYGGDFLVRVYPGFTGAVIEDSDLVCPKATKGTALAFGRYTANRVDVSGCKNAFLSTGGSVRVNESLWNGRPVSLSVGRASVPETTAAPTTTLAEPSMAPPFAATTSPPTAAPAPPTTAASRPPTGGFPDESNTGVPAGVDLTPSGSVTVTEDGTVLDGLHITGTVTIEADDVTIRNTRIDNTSDYPIRTTAGGTNLVVEDTEINGNGQGNVAVYGGEYTLRRLNIHDTLDGPRIEGNNVSIEDCYIHHLHRIPDGHHDTLQIRRGIGVRIMGNNLQPFNPDTNDPMNAAIQIGSLNGPTGDVVVQGNLMNGGNYTVNAGKAGGNSFVFRNNVFGDDARYGIYAAGPGVQWEASNILQTTGESVG